MWQINDSELLGKQKGPGARFPWHWLVPRGARQGHRKRPPQLAPLWTRTQPRKVLVGRIPVPETNRLATSNETKGATVSASRVKSRKTLYRHTQGKRSTGTRKMKMSVLRVMSV